MPLTSLESAPQPLPVPLKPLGFRIGTPDVAEATGVANQAMYELGLDGFDTDKNLKELADAFNALTTPGYDGRLHFLPDVPFAHILQTAEGKRQDSVAEVWAYHNLWTSGTKKNSYTKAELNTGPAGHVARLALFNSQNTGYDPILHSLNVPFDNYKGDQTDVNPDSVPTQLDEFKEDRQTVVTRHEGYTLDYVDHRAFAMMALMDRIRGVEPKYQILSQGFMRIPKLGRRTVDGVSVVGHVYSVVGRLRFDRSRGGAHQNGGVGRSMGLSEA